MNALKNKVHLIGNLGIDPEIKNFDNGKMIAKFPLATTETYYDNDGNKSQDTQWHNVVAWNGTAKIVKQLLKKGSSIVLEGKIVYRTYEDKDGAKKYYTEILCNEFILVK